MNLNSDFDFLCGTVSVGQVAPKAWRESTLNEFFFDPNHAEWGRELCRKLYHETLHFWQLIGCGYIGNCVAADWARLLAFERTGTMPPPARNGLDAMDEANGGPFSPRELMEAHARYWDVHTRGPATLIEDEGISTVGVNGPLSLPHLHEGGIRFYTGEAYDLVMRQGRDCTQYARPYRWLLDQSGGHSAFAAIMFPFCAHLALGTPDPVKVFCAAIDIAWRSKPIQRLLRGGTRSIHEAWMLYWPALNKQVFGQAAMHAGVRGFTSGFDVIERGALKEHPLYREYPENAHFRGYFKCYKPTPVGTSPTDEQHASDLHQTVMENPNILFALPGEPIYRRALGELVPPPIVRFENFTHASTRPVLGKLRAAQTGEPWEDTFASAAADVEQRVKRFRDADYAVSIGLAPDHFEHPARNAQRSTAASRFNPTATIQRPNHS